MEKQTLLIADGNEVICQVLTELLQDDFEIYSTCDGVQALEWLLQLCPEMAMLDMSLPGMDGVSILRKMVQKGVFVKVLASVTCQDPAWTGELQKLGVCQMLQKPFRILGAAELLRQMAGKDRDAQRYEQVTEILRDICISAKYDGYDYLRSAVIEFGKNPEQSFTKVLYPAVAQKHGVSGKQVEHSIRTAIKVAWKKGDRERQCRYFPGGRPTNGEAISQLAEYVYPQERRMLG